MANNHLVTVMRDALRAGGVDDTVLVVGNFSPKGSSNASAAGYVLGDFIGSAGGAIGGVIGAVGGSEAAERMAGRRQELPRDVVVGVSPTAVYGSTLSGFGTPPAQLLFAYPREGLHVSTGTTLFGRTLELTPPGSPAGLRLEGSRLGVAGCGAVVAELTGR